MGGKVSAVLFVKDLSRMTAFYRAILHARPGCFSDNHATLNCNNFALSLHQLPEHYAADVHIENPPRRREQAAIKLCFPVDSIVRVREAAAAHGGMLDAGPPRWVVEPQTICNGNDPEGNVFQVHEE